MKHTHAQYDTPNNTHKQHQHKQTLIYNKNNKKNTQHTKQKT